SARTRERGNDADLYACHAEAGSRCPQPIGWVSRRATQSCACLAPQRPAEGTASPRGVTRGVGAATRNSLAFFDALESTVSTGFPVDRSRELAAMPDLRGCRWHGRFLRARGHDNFACHLCGMHSQRRLSPPLGRATMSGTEKKASV